MNKVNKYVVIYKHQKINIKKLLIKNYLSNIFSDIYLGLIICTKPDIESDRLNISHKRSSRWDSESFFESIFNV